MTTIIVRGLRRVETRPDHSSGPFQRRGLRLGFAFENSGQKVKQVIELHVYKTGIDNPASRCILVLTM